MGMMKYSYYASILKVIKLKSPLFSLGSQRQSIPKNVIDSMSPGYKQQNAKS